MLSYNPPLVSSSLTKCYPYYLTGIYFSLFINLLDQQMLGEGGGKQPITVLERIVNFLSGDDLTLHLLDTVGMQEVPIVIFQCRHCVVPKKKGQAGDSSHCKCRNFCVLLCERWPSTEEQDIPV